MAISWTTDGGLSVSVDGLTTDQQGSSGFNFSYTNEDGEKSTGKWYFEVTLYRLDSNDTNCIKVGVCEVTPSLTGYAVGSEDAITCSGDDVYISVVLEAAINVATVGVAVDVDNNKVWFSVNGVWTGDPEAGTGASSSSVPDNVRPYVSLYTLGDSATAAFMESSQTYDLPSGFSPLDETVVPATPASMSGTLTLSGTFNAVNVPIAVTDGTLVFSGDIYAVSYERNSISGSLTLSGSMSAYYEGEASVLGILSLDGSFIATAPTVVSMLGVLSLEGTMDSILHGNYISGTFELTGVMDAMTKGLCGMSGTISFVGDMGALYAYSLALPAYSSSRWS